MLYIVLDISSEKHRKIRSYLLYNKNLFKDIKIQYVDMFTIFEKKLTVPYLYDGENVYKTYNEIIQYLLEKNAKM